MTLMSVQGCGMQKGNIKYYRGAKLDVQLLPKIKLEAVVTKVPVELVVETARKALYTGNYGDGKIFIYNVLDVVKIRTENADTTRFRMTNSSILYSIFFLTPFLSRSGVSLFYLLAYRFICFFVL